nr:ATP-binding protein [Mesorhizobium sp.]
MREARRLEGLADTVATKLQEFGLREHQGRERLARVVVEDILSRYAEVEDVQALPVFRSLAACVFDHLEREELFAIPETLSESAPARSALWEAEDRLLATAKLLDSFDAAMGQLADLFAALIEPLARSCPALLSAPTGDAADIVFQTPLALLLPNLPEAVEYMVQMPFAPELNEYGAVDRLRRRLEFNLAVVSGGDERAAKLPTRARDIPATTLVAAYLGGTPLEPLFDIAVPIAIPTEVRFEHHHIVAGSGHGKTQTLQHLILHDLQAVAEGRASVIVIDSQSDLIDTISGLAVFAEGGPLAGRLCLIDPTDVEWPVALNLFDAGLARFSGYAPLDQERLLNGVLELYDFVLGSLLDAGMTQKQSVIFRYITRLLLHIPDATIHTLRELLEDDGYARHAEHIGKLEGSARAFFENEFRGKEFAQTRRQVLRRLYGILENPTFERMFSHPKSKLDLFAEMNAGKVILINTAKDLLKENGTEIFGRFFIAMIAQAAQERAVLQKGKRLPTFVYVDEASDYFDRNIGIILSQARKNRVGMVLSHQYLGQLDPKLHEAIAANTAIKFAGGVSAKDARALAGDLRADAEMIESQERLSFAAYVKGVTKRAVSIHIKAGRMEAEPRMSAEERSQLRDVMRKKYAVHHTEARAQTERRNPPDAPSEPDTGEPMPWN